MAKRRKGIPARVIVVVAVLFMVNAFLGFSIASESERALVDQIQTRMADLSGSASELLDGDSLGSLTAKDKDTPAFRQVVDTLSAFRDEADIKYIYCIRETTPGSFEITVDPSLTNVAEFGDSAESTEALIRAASGEPSVDLIAYEDRWGRFYSAYSPVFDSKGQVAGIVAVDVDAAWFEEHSTSINRKAIINSIVSLVLALVAFIVALRMSRAETRHWENLQNASRTDFLTGLANLGYFGELAETARDELAEQGRTPVMLYMNLAGMKHYNQKWGYAEGDALIKAFAGLLAERFGHERCSRFGQDHFCAISYADGLEARLDAFLEECEALNGGRGLPVRIGIYSDALGKVDVGTACDRAKMACDASSGEFRSSYSFFDADMMVRTKRRQHVIENLDRAIDEGWIEVHYQPIVRASSGRVCDEEALARWVDPELGMLSPAEFIPALEDAKLVYRLDLCVLSQVLEKMNSVIEEGLFLVPASVNLSRSDFAVCDIVEEVRKRVDESGIPRSAINIEITESAIGRDFEFMSEQVARFHDLGFRVWMDDFGSEYSSFDYLQILNVDLLKLDMRFMQQFDGDAKSGIILSELVRMALGLGIDTVAEGVETEEQVDFLREIGCGMLQGFYFCKPLPFEAVLDRYKDGTAIGFENPEESVYYAELGRVNLYDLSSIACGEEDSAGHYFDMLPMAVIESTVEDFAVLRCNRSYVAFMAQVLGGGRVAERVSYERVRISKMSPKIQNHQSY